MHEEAITLEMKVCQCQDCKTKYPWMHTQPERSKREDFYGRKASVDSNGILTMETGEQFDLNQPIEDAVL